MEAISGSMAGSPKLRVLMNYWSIYQQDEEFGRQHDCEPMRTKIPYEWPLGLDIVKRQYDALGSQHLLAFQLQYLDHKPNLELRHLGMVGYVTTDPENIESMLSTRFEGIVFLKRSISQRISQADILMNWRRLEHWYCRCSRTVSRQLMTLAGSRSPWFLSMLQ